MEQKPQIPSSRGRWNPWPVSIVAFFTVAIIGCATFIVFCSRHPADLVAADYYEQEVRYQKQIDGLQRAQKSADSLVVTYDQVARSILVSLPPDQRSDGISGTIQLYRPSAVNLDRQLKLEPDAAGVQRIDAAPLSPGLWKVRVSWTAGNRDFYLDQKIVIGPKPS